MAALSPATPVLPGPAPAQTVCMDLALIWKRWLRRWQLPRAGRRAVRPSQDPADCGTAWGLDLTLPPARAKTAEPRPPR